MDDNKGKDSSSSIKNPNKGVSVKVDLSKPPTRPFARPSNNTPKKVFAKPFQRKSEEKEVPKVFSLPFKSHRSVYVPKKIPEFNSESEQESKPNYVKTIMYQDEDIPEDKLDDLIISDEKEKESLDEGVIVVDDIEDKYENDNLIEPVNEDLVDDNIEECVNEEDDNYDNLIKLGNSDLVRDDIETLPIFDEQNNDDYINIDSMGKREDRIRKQRIHEYRINRTKGIRYKERVVSVKSSKLKKKVYVKKKQPSANQNKKFNRLDSVYDVVLGITTYNRIGYLRSLINSFIKTREQGYKWYLIIADDGSTDGTLEFLDKLRIHNTEIIVIKNSRAHIAKQTNSIFEVCEGLKYDFGFMVDDDIYFKKPGWDNAYMDAAFKNDMDHLVYFNPNEVPNIYKPYICHIGYGDLVANIDAKHCMGCFWTFTPKVLELVGYFRDDLFRGSGYAHQDYTMRCCMAGFNNEQNIFDVVGSNDYVHVRTPTNDKSYVSHKTVDFIKQNEKLLDSVYDRPIRYHIKVEQKKQTITEHNPIFNNYGIFQLSVSPGLKHFEGRFRRMYNLRQYTDRTKLCLFFGLYEIEDLKRLSQHNGDRYVLWGGTDANPEYSNYPKIVPNVAQIDVKQHFSTSDDLYNRLTSAGIKSRKIKFSLVDKELFKPVDRKGSKVFIYNGYTKGKEHLYGKEIYEEVVRRLPQYEYIYSNELNKPYEDMPKVYAECFIGLRLTPHDGNANMVQEMEAMDIPVVHNHSEYGLKWKTVDDVVNHISESLKTVLICSHSNLNVVGGDTIWLTNLANIYYNKGYYVTILNHTKLRNTNFSRNLQKGIKITIVETGSQLSWLNQNSQLFSKIIVRNHNILDGLKNRSWLSKTILYGLDIHLSIIKGLSGYKRIWTQSQKLKKMYVDEGVDPTKIKIKEPIGYRYKFKEKPRHDNDIRFIYVGTLRDEENILEILEGFQEFHKQIPNSRLTFCYGKIYESEPFKTKINSIISKGLDGVVFKHNLPHIDCLKEIAQSDVGICWRKNGWGDNGEQPTKVKEYELYGLTIIRSNPFKLFQKDIKINFLFNDLSYITNGMGGCFANQVNLAINLNQYCSVYFNSIPVEKIIKNFDFNSELAEVEYEKAKEEKGVFDFTKNTIRYDKNDYCFTFMRYYNKEIFYNILQKLPGKKVCSHQYVESIWNNPDAVVGFQTKTAQNLVYKKEIHNYENDGTENYTSEMKLPYNSMVFHQFIKNALYKPIGKPRSSIFKIGLIGNINQFNYPHTLFKICRDLIKSGESSIEIAHLTKININKDKIKDSLGKYSYIYKPSYIDNSDEYFNTLCGFDVIVNSWRIDNCQYAGSNKNLDAVNCLVPIILPYSPSYSEQFGEDYPLFFNYHKNSGYFNKETENSIKTMLLKLKKDPIYKQNIINYLAKIKRKHNYLTILKYRDQFGVLNRKILVVSNNFNIGGLQTYLKQIVNYYKTNSITILAENIDDKPNDDFKYIKFTPEVLDKLENYDICFLNSYPIINSSFVKKFGYQKNYFETFITKIKSKTKLLFPIIHSEFNQFTFDIAKTVDMYDCLICVSYKVMKKIRMGTGKEFNFKIIPPCIKLDTNQRDTNLKYRVGFFSRMEKWKGVELLVEYWKKLCLKYPEWKLVLIGDSTQSSKIWYDNLIGKIEKDAILSKYVEIDRRVVKGEEDKVNTLTRLDMFISTSYAEGLPFTVIECLNLGVPVIHTKLGGIPEVIIPGLNGDILNFECLNISELKPCGEILDNLDVDFEKNYKIFEQVVGKYLDDTDKLLQLKHNTKLILHKYSYENSKSLLYELDNKLYSKKPLMVITGHDLHFVNFDKDIKNYEVKLVDFPFDFLYDAEGYSVDLSKHVDSIYEIMKADVVFCEWCWANAVWMSHNKNFEQKLFIRLHRFEINGKHFPLINVDNVNKLIFISNNIRKKLVGMYNQFDQISTTVYNKTKIIDSDVDEVPDRCFNLGVLGYIPQIKRVDISIKILKLLEDRRYKLYIKGKKPYGWILKSQKEYYTGLDKMIKDHNLEEQVVFEEFDNSVDGVKKWFKKIGFIMSTSDVEGSHQAVCEGMFYGCVPIITGGYLKDYDAHMHYPITFCHTDNKDAVKFIKRLDTSQRFDTYSKCAIKFAKNNFGGSKFVKNINGLLDGNPTDSDCLNLSNLRIKVCLIVTSINLNIIDGSTIFLVNLLNLLLLKKQIYVVLLSKINLKEFNVLNNINKSFVNIYEPKHFYNKEILQGEDYERIIHKIQKYTAIDFIVVRGDDIVDSINDTKLIEKMFIYKCNTHSFNKLDQCRGVLSQTSSMSNNFVEYNKNIEILPPMVKEIVSKPHKNINCVYVGTLRPEYASIEIITSFMDELQDVNLTCVYGKIYDPTKSKEFLKIYEYIAKPTKNIKYFKQLKHQETLQIVADSYLGISWRNNIMNSNDEISTKMLEYLSLGKPIVVNKNKNTVQLLGNDYPYFANSRDEFIKIVKLAVNNETLYQKTKKSILDKIQKFQLENNYDPIYSFLTK